MGTSLRVLISQFVGVVVAALVPVILTAFLSMPFILGGHPGEIRSTDALLGQHMS